MSKFWKLLLLQRKSPLSKQQMESQIEHYESLDELPLYNWDKYLSTNCNNWFIKGFDGRQKIIANETLFEIERKFQDDYFILLDDPAFTLRLQKWAKIEALRTKYMALCSIIQRMKIGFSKDQQEVRMKYIDTLEKSGFRMPKINTLEGDAQELAQIQLKVDSIKTQMEILIDEVRDETKGGKTPLQKQLLHVSMALKLGYRLDPKQISVTEWISMLDIIKERSKTAEK